MIQYEETICVVSCLLFFLVSFRLVSKKKLLEENPMAVSDAPGPSSLNLSTLIARLAGCGPLLSRSSALLVDVSDKVERWACAEKYEFNASIQYLLAEPGRFTVPDDYLILSDALEIPLLSQTACTNIQALPLVLAAVSLTFESESKVATKPSLRVFDTYEKKQRLCDLLLCMLIVSDGLRARLSTVGATFATLGLVSAEDGFDGPPHCRALPHCTVSSVFRQVCVSARSCVLFVTVVPAHRDDHVIPMDHSCESSAEDVHQVMRDLTAAAWTTTTARPPTSDHTLAILFANNECVLLQSYYGHYTFESWLAFDQPLMRSTSLPPASSASWLRAIVPRPHYRKRLVGEAECMELAKSLDSLMDNDTCHLGVYAHLTGILHDKESIARSYKMILSTHLLP